MQVTVDWVHNLHTTFGSFFWHLHIGLPNTRKLSESCLQILNTLELSKTFRKATFSGVWHQMRAQRVGGGRMALITIYLVLPRTLALSSARRTADNGMSSKGLSMACINIPWIFFKYVDQKYKRQSWSWISWKTPLNLRRFWTGFRPSKVFLAVSKFVGFITWYNRRLVTFRKPNFWVQIGNPHDSLEAPLWEYM